MKKPVKVGSFFGSTQYELDNFLCGIGESRIEKDHIVISNYPFRPSSVFPERKIQPSEIQEIHIDCYPPTLKISDELIFISREYEEKLLVFMRDNYVNPGIRHANWELITEPFLDTEFSDIQNTRTIQMLVSRGIPEGEIKDLREEVGEQMMKYNFDTMLWEWTNLGLNDVLAAMRVKYDNTTFEEFYWRAMEIEQRGRNLKTPKQ